MRKTVLISVIITLLAALLSVAAGLLAPITYAGDAIPSESPDATPSYEPQLPPSGWRDADFTLRVQLDGETREMAMDAYLTGVVAAEMPASFEPDALCAQAVAARTYALRSFVEPRHADCDVCGDYTHCAAYATLDLLREKWGADFDANLEKIRAAVSATDGVYITYAAAPALTVFHSSSQGTTENCEAVWSSAYPYLVSVPTPETEESVPNFISTVTVTPSDFAETVKAAHPEADFSRDKSEWLGVTVTDAAGRLASVMIGGVEIKGTELRALFGLRSTAVSVEIGENVVFTTAGYGHGVGMSQYGANAMAQNGTQWRDILRAYYTGVGFSDDRATL